MDLRDDVLKSSQEKTNFYRAETIETANRSIMQVTVVEEGVDKWGVGCGIITCTYLYDDGRGK